MAHVVKTGSGKIRGVHEEGVLAFRSIPYVQSPYNFKVQPRSAATG